MKNVVGDMLDFQVFETSLFFDCDMSVDLQHYANNNELIKEYKSA
jgi:hypothetical protein